jgi:acyl-CoA thioesterase FadM
MEEARRLYTNMIQKKMEEPGRSTDTKINTRVRSSRTRYFFPVLVDDVILVHVRLAAIEPMGFHFDLFLTTEKSGERPSHIASTVADYLDPNDSPVAIPADVISAAEAIEGRKLRKEETARL